jgi:hypothetical protein
MLVTGRRLTIGSAWCRHQGPEREVDDRLGLVEVRGRKLTPVLVTAGAAPPVDARARPPSIPTSMLVTRGRRLKLTIGPAWSRVRRVKLTPVLVTRATR